MQNYDYFLQLFQIVVFVAYLWYERTKGPYSDSVSSGWYTWKDDGSKAWTDRFLFNIMIFNIAWPAVIIFDQSGRGDQVGVIAIIGAMVLQIIAVAADFRNNDKYPGIAPIHYGASYLGIAALVFACGIYGDHWLTWIIPAIGVAIYFSFEKKWLANVRVGNWYFRDTKIGYQILTNPTRWVEVAMFVLVVIGESFV